MDQDSRHLQRWSRTSGSRSYETSRPLIANQSDIVADKHLKRVVVIERAIPTSRKKENKKLGNS